MPFFVHSLVTLPRSTVARRGRAGLILGKAGDYFKDPAHKAMIRNLTEAGFELHSTCQSNCNFPVGVNIVHVGGLSPSGFATYLRKMAFLLGFGDPHASPSPLEALAAGVAFLQPASLSKSGVWTECKARPGVENVVSQHSALAALGQPYVYNYDPDDVSTLVAAAESAYRHRFASFVPIAHRIESAAAHVCSALVENDALCTCAQARLDGHALDCRGSHYTTVNGDEQHMAWQRTDVPPIFTSVL